mgnify:CR=1 FL=1
MLDALEDHELPEFRSEEWLWQALVLAVRDNARARGTSRAVVALEGDLPSSLLAALAVDALGSRNVIGLVLGRNRHLYTGVRRRPRPLAVPPSAPLLSACIFARLSAMRRMPCVCSIATCRRATPSACVRVRWALCWRTRRSSWARWL